MSTHHTGSAQQAAPPHYDLQLFVTGASANSIRAIANLNSICELYLKGRCALQIIDVYQQPELAAQEQIIALPMLVKRAPGAERRLIGDMSNLQKVLRALNIFPE